jgi:arsenical pump membrane protein
VLLVALVLASLDGIEAGWVAAIGAALLGGYALTRGLARPRRLVRAASVDFVAFVACLQIVVDAARRQGLGDAVADRLPGGQGLGTLLAVAVLAAVLANLVNNLPATLILLPALAGRPVAVVLAMLLGVNIGPNLTYTGSLATLLWRKVVRADRVEPATGAYYRVALAATPAALIAATIALWVSVRAIG